MNTQLDTAKIEHIRRLVDAGFAGELRLVLAGASAYNSPVPENDVVYPPEFADGEGGMHVMTWVMAHLEFISKFGTTVDHMSRGSRNYFAHPTEYELWLSCGAPGVWKDELEAMEAGKANFALRP